MFYASTFIYTYTSIAVDMVIVDGIAYEERACKPSYID